jgi:hypothetical protein
MRIQQISSDFAGGKTTENDDTKSLTFFLGIKVKTVKKILNSGSWKNE